MSLVSEQMLSVRARHVAAKAVRTFPPISPTSPSSDALYLPADGSVSEGGVGGVRWVGGLEISFGFP